MNPIFVFEPTKENYYRGNTRNILSVVERDNLKSEFVLIINNYRFWDWRRWRFQSTNVQLTNEPPLLPISC